MTPAALIRAQAMRTPFRRLGQRRARWLAWRATDEAPIIGPGWKRKARRMLAWSAFAWWVYLNYARR